MADIGNLVVSRTFGLNDWVEESHGRAAEKGWWDDCAYRGENDDFEILNECVYDKIPEKLALIHSEVSEALEDFRNGTMVTDYEENGKPVGFNTELADILIRVFDLAGALGIDLEKEVRIKSDFNETRQRRHGGKRC